MIRTETYQRLLLALLVLILVSNLVQIVDNWQTRKITDGTFSKVIEILEVPPSQVYERVGEVQEDLKEIRNTIEDK